MNIEELRDFCLSLPHTEEKLPFDDNTLVFTVMNKMFCLTDIDEFDSINLKCEPEKACTLREKYLDISPGYHMNKKHWNTIKTKTQIPDKLIKEWIIDSYKLVIAKLPKSLRESFPKNI